MSVEFYAVCRSPLPTRSDEWSFQIGPVAVSLGSDDPDWLAELRELVPDLQSVVVFSSRAHGSEIGEGLARIVATMIGGALVYEDGPELLQDFAKPRIPPDAASIEVEMQTFLAAENARAQAEQARARAAYERLIAADPDKKKKEDDWSDV